MDNAIPEGEGKPSDIYQLCKGCTRIAKRKGGWGRTPTHIERYGTQERADRMASSYDDAMARIRAHRATETE